MASKCRYFYSSQGRQVFDILTHFLHVLDHLRLGKLYKMVYITRILHNYFQNDCHKFLPETSETDG